MSNRTRVVITGRGVVSPVGTSIASFWDSLVIGRSGIRRITLFAPSDMPTQIAGELEDWEPSPWIDTKEARRMSRASQFALAAATQAMEDAGLGDDLDDEASVLLGTGIGGVEKSTEGAYQVVSDRGWRAIQPFTLAAALPSIPAYHVAQRFNIRGHLSTVVAACASSTQAIGEAAELMRRGRSEIVVTGGVEAPLIEVCMGGFCAMRGMSTRNDDPEGAVRPFDRNRDGFLMSEGAAIFVLETRDRALARGARIYCDGLAGGSASGAFHVARAD